MTLLAQSSAVTKELNSTFTGNVYGTASETYSEGTLTTSEGNTWTWREGGEAKSPIIKMEELDGWSCLSVKPKTSYTQIHKLSIPNSVTDIGYYAFYGCKNLQTVVIGKGLTKIGDNPFYISNNITDVFCFANPDVLTWESGSYEDRAFMADRATKMRVYAADLAKYEEKFSFLNVTFVGDLEDWEDGIDEVRGETEDAAWYDLSGKPVTKPRQNGIYIRGGKKILVKWFSSVAPSEETERVAVCNLLGRVLTSRKEAYIIISN